MSGSESPTQETSEREYAETGGQDDITDGNKAGSVESDGVPVTSEYNKDETMDNVAFKHEDNHNPDEYWDRQQNHEGGAPPLGDGVGESEDDGKRQGADGEVPQSFEEQDQQQPPPLPPPQPPSGWPYDGMGTGNGRNPGRDSAADAVMEDSLSYYRQHQLQAHSAMNGYNSSVAMAASAHHHPSFPLNSSMPMDYFAEMTYNSSRPAQAAAAAYYGRGFGHNYHLPPDKKNDNMGHSVMQTPNSPSSHTLQSQEGRADDLSNHMIHQQILGRHGGYTAAMNSPNSLQRHSASPRYPPAAHSSSWPMQLPGESNSIPHPYNINNPGYYDSMYSAADISNLSMERSLGARGGRLYEDHYPYDSHSAATLAAGSLPRGRENGSSGKMESSHFCPPPSNIPNQMTSSSANDDVHHPYPGSKPPTNSNHQRRTAPKVYVSPSPSDHDTTGISPSSTLSSNSYCNLSYPHQQTGGNKPNMASKPSQMAGPSSVSDGTANKADTVASSGSVNSRPGNTSSTMTDRKHMQSKAWYDRFQELQEYRELHGHCMVPQKYDKNPSLGIWVNKQRMEYKLLQDGEKSSMTPERLSALQSVGFIWAKRKGQATWDAKYKQLKEYKRIHGDCLIPTKYANDPALGRWVSTQREQYRLWRAGDMRTKMNQEKVRLLEEVGFVWRLQF